MFSLILDVLEQFLTIFLAISIAPSPPFSQPSTMLISIFFSFNFCSSQFSSFSVSDVYLFSATITFNPNLFFILSICLYKFSIPFSRPLIFSFWISSLSTPPWYFIAFMVATITTTSGFILAFLHFMSRNFSAPKSAPNPASVIV